MDRLLLWDIDRTLLKVPGFGEQIYAAALVSVTGRRLEHMPELGGKTDHELVTAVLQLHGVPVTAGIHEDFYGALTVAARKLNDDMRLHGSALPGARDALVALAGEPRVVQSVVTGNIRPIAEQKLGACHLAEWIDVEVGGYGSDDAARSTLVRLALERAEAKYRTTVAADHVVVIGDTPLDIVGARANGAVAVGVATGSSSAEELAAAGAHVVLPSLADTAAVVRTVLGGTVTPYA